MVSTAVDSGLLRPELLAVAESALPLGGFLERVAEDLFFECLVSLLDSDLLEEDLDFLLSVLLSDMSDLSDISNRSPLSDLEDFLELEEASDLGGRESETSVEG